MSIIDLIPLTKIDDVSSWFNFGKLCWLFGYPCEQCDYFSKRSITKYNYEENLQHYRNTYKEYRQRLINILNKKGTLKESENILKCEYINTKNN